MIVNSQYGGVAFIKATKTDILIVVVLFVLALFSFRLQSYVRAQGSEAHVFIDGNLSYKIDLGIDREYSVEVPNGEATITVTGGKLYITAAPCPRRICIDDSPISNRGESLVCVPNRMVVKIDGGGDDQLDTITR